MVVVTHVVVWVITPCSAVVPVGMGMHPTCIR